MDLLGSKDVKDRKKYCRNVVRSVVNATKNLSWQNVCANINKYTGNSAAYINNFSSLPTLEEVRRDSQVYTNRFK